MSFSALKKSNFQDLLSKAENLNKTETKSGPDERLWNCLLYTSDAADE